jgi:ferrochelatase
MFKTKKTAILLINLGTPDAPKVKDVRRYLSEFLNDKRVIDIPWLLRKMLVNLIIVPFRAPKSTKLYQKLWTEKGSPLLFHGLSLKAKLQKLMGDDYVVEFGMNYQNPSLRKAIKNLVDQNVTRIIAFPLFPQYASSSTGSALENMYKYVAEFNDVPEIQAISYYYQHPSYIDALASTVAKHDWKSYDHIMMSFHGLPTRQVYRSHGDKPCDGLKCKESFQAGSEFCYQAACYETSRLLAAKLGIPKEKYTTSFQSRLSKEWLTPFSDKLLEEFTAKGIKKLLVVSPAFTADCLETTVEIGIDYKEAFLALGGQQLDLVASLNDNEDWVQAIRDIIADKMKL